MISFIAGATYRETFLLTDSRNTPRNLLGATIELATAAFSATVTILDQTTNKGQFTIELAAAASAAVPVKAYPFQLFVTYPDGFVEVPLEGMIYIRKSERVL